MPFDCEYRDIPIEDAARLTRDAIAAWARERGLGAVYVVAGVETVSHRWHHRVVDVVVHMADGDDVLGMQFPDEARAAVTAAVQALLHASWHASVAGDPKSAAGARSVLALLQHRRARERAEHSRDHETRRRLLRDD